jgi:hypothetical protein
VRGHDAAANQDYVGDGGRRHGRERCAAAASPGRPFIFPSPTRARCRLRSVLRREAR